MKITISDDHGHPVDNISIVDDLVEVGEVASIVTTMIKDYVEYQERVKDLEERRARRQLQVDQQFQDKEDVPF